MKVFSLFLILSILNLSAVFQPPKNIIFDVNPTTGLITTEGGESDTFTISLDIEPTDTVRIDLSSSNPNEGTVSPAFVEFTVSDWDQAQTITVTGVNDDIDDDDTEYTIQTLPATSADPTYDGQDLLDDVIVTNTDDDTAGVTVSHDPDLETTENEGMAQFNVVLDSQPTADVTIGIASSNPSEGTVSSSSLTFTESDWDTQQTITITGQNDDIDDGDVSYSIQIQAAASTDPKYNGLDLEDDVAVTNIDDDTAGVTFNPVPDPETTLETTEGGGTDQFSMVLDSQPTANVTFGISSSTPSEGTVSSSSLTFSEINWNTPQTITITGQDDYLNDGDIGYSISISNASSTDPKYAGFFGVDFHVTNFDQYTIPTAHNDIYNVPGNDPFSVIADNGVLTNDEVEEVQESTFSAILVSGVSHGSLTLNSDGSFDYTPTTNYAGVDSFTYKTNDGISDSNQTTVTLNVYIDNYPPTGTDDTYQTDEDIPLTQASPGILTNDNDLDDDPLSVSLITDVDHGSLVLNTNGSFTYSPDENYSGEDQFIYQAFDGEFYSENTTVTITINPVNDAPAGTADTYLLQTTDDTPINIPTPGVLNNDSDLENNPISAVIYETPAYGTVNLSGDGSFTYTPFETGARNDSFTYRVFDGEDYSAPVTVTIDGPPPPPSWISPVEDNGIYYVYSGNINLETTITDPPEDIVKVIYKWWNPTTSSYIILGEKTNTPYSVQISATDLDPEWNQIFAVAIDNAGIESKYVRILIWRDPTLRIYLPLITR